MTTANHDDIRNIVQTTYDQIAATGQTCCSSASAGGSKPDSTSTCCGYKTKRSSKQFAEKLGYTAEELTSLPEGSYMGLSCGNPTAIAALKEGETVLDLGSGGGFDVFIAARKVGPNGLAIGVDMTPSMIHKARNNAEVFRKQQKLNNVEFRLGEIEHLPLADESVDVVISNCVINLSPDKEQVWKEVGRVLKPGGRACVSDIALLQPLPKALRESIHALVGCVAGAMLIDDVVRMVEAAGLIVTSAERESVFAEEREKSDDPIYKDIMKEVPEGCSPRDYVTSLRLVATKPK